MCSAFYNAGREAYIQGLRVRHNPFPTDCVPHVEWNRGNVQEHHDEHDVLTMERTLSK